MLFNRKYIIILILFLAGSTSLRAQLSFCANYTDAGDPMGVSNTWKLSLKGGYVYMLYSNKKKTIRPKTLSIVVFRESIKDYLPYDKAVMEVQDKKNWAVFDYHFVEAGNYKVLIQDNNHELARSFVSISLQGAKKEGEITIDDKYYSNSVLSFCTAVDNNMPKGASKAFTTGKLYIHLLNDKPLGVDSMILMVHKKTVGSTTYDQYYDLVKAGIGPSYNMTYLEYNFTEEGEYQVEIYTQKFIKMGEGFVQIVDLGQNPTTTDNKKAPDNTIDPDIGYYNATMSFCEQVTDGKLIKESNSFKSGTFYVVVRNDKAIATDSIYMDVQKKAFNADKYNIYVTSKTYGVDKTSPGTYFDLDIEETGQYKVEVFNRRMQKIAEGYVSVR